MQEWSGREEGALAPSLSFGEYLVNPDKPLPWNGDRSSLLSLLALLALLGEQQTYRILQETAGQGELPLTQLHQHTVHSSHTAHSLPLDSILHSRGKKFQQHAFPSLSLYVRTECGSVCLHHCAEGPQTIPCLLGDLKATLHILQAPEMWP